VNKRIEPLDQSHDRAGFDCGSDDLNRFLRQTARQHIEKGISSTHVLIETTATEPKPILGFFSLAACEIETASLPPHLSKKYPRRIPAARLGRLAVSVREQGKGLGATLLIAAMEKVSVASGSIGIAALFVDAKDEKAAAFYRHFGFVPLPSQPLTLFLPQADIAKLLPFK
jgi:GNAT superfamily N-acetyltransferase